jgi:hypothetical protein
MQSTNIWAVYNNKEINSDKRTNTNYWKGKIVKSDRKRKTLDYKMRRRFEVKPAHALQLKRGARDVAIFF